MMDWVSRTIDTMTVGFYHMTKKFWQRLYIFLLVQMSSVIIIVRLIQNQHYYVLLFNIPIYLLTSFVFIYGYVRRRNIRMAEVINEVINS